jgi:hypothetical protein
VLAIATFLSTASDPNLRGAHPGTRARAVQPVPEDMRSGLIAALDLDSGEVQWSKALDSPAGFSFVGRRLFVNSMFGNRVTVLSDELDVLDSFGNPIMNDLHTIRCTASGLLITSSGTDAIVELTTEGDINWLWLACAHGYRRTALGTATWTRRARDYRFSMVDTLDQTTHCNSAISVNYRGRETVVATLFHQGEVIAIDKASGRHEVVFRGLRRPHSIRQTDDGWLVCDSRSGVVLLLDRHFWISRVIDHDFNWVQDALALDDETLLVADSNNSRLIIWNIVKDKVEHEIRYPELWRIFQIEVDIPDWARKISCLCRIFETSLWWSARDYPGPGLSVTDA